MTNIYKLAFSFAIVVALSLTAQAGNDTKRGQGGASELLVNPWAQSSGWAGSNLASVGGVESMNINVAGLTEVVNTEAALASVRYMSGAGVSIYSLGLGQRLNEYSSLGISFTNWSIGDIQATTYEKPDGIGTVTPTLFNFAVGYSRMFSEKISAGILVRGISQSLPNLSSFGLAADAGIQYRTGEKKEFQIGVTLKNIGPKMNYQGSGIGVTGAIQNNNDQAKGSALQQVLNGFEMPVQLAIGSGYDFYLKETSRISIRGTFQSNSFTQDQILLGAEYGFNELFMVRAGYNAQPHVTGVLGGTRTDVNRGLTAGFTVNAPLDQILRSDNGGEVAKTKGKRVLGISYSYRSTNPFNGTHSLGLSLSL